jgi:LysR family cyn operon transcriptional activator
MELRQLRYFLAVAEHRNFTRAAHAVHVSQPSLSVQIRDLEEELGSPLFDRLGRQIHLTPAGEVLLEHSQRVMRDLERAGDAIRELTGAERGRLAVGTLSTVNTYLVPRLVTEFRKHFPKIHLQVQARPSLEIESALLRNELDVGICLLPVSHDHLQATKLFDETLCLVGPASGRGISSRRRLRLRELGDLPMILMPADYCLRKMIEAECAEAGVRPQVAVEMTSPEGIVEAVTRGTGWTVLPELYVRQHLRGKALHVVELYDPVPRHAVGLVQLSRRHLGMAAQAFVRLCGDTIATLKGAPSRLPTRVAG